MNPSSFHPHERFRPASSRQIHGQPPPERRLAHHPLEQRGRVMPVGAARLPLLEPQTPTVPHSLATAAPLNLRHASEAALRGRGLVGSRSLSRTPGAATSGGIRPPRYQTAGAGGLHPQRSMSVSVQPLRPPMPGAVPTGLHPPHAQTSGVVPGALQTPEVPSGGLQQGPPRALGPRKLSDSDAPPNVTVSTSTIPLSMAAGLHQQGGGDLSSIVHRINQLCQARAGAGATSVCEGQIANPSPISRNLLINASSRVSAPGLQDALPGAAIPLHLGPSVANALAAFPADGVQGHRQCVWAQHRQPPEGIHPCESLHSDRTRECAFRARTLGKPARGHPPGPYADDDCANSPWGASQVPMGFQAGRTVGAKYRLGQESLPGRSRMASDLDFFGGRDFLAAGFRDPKADSTDGSAAGPPRSAASALRRAYR
ncbi:protein FAM222B-like [Syngnathus typhle]|uniref:protein FAM222B-like n=1 Tax=Syngnathus typhle TaxID=161592 RepID=UPI002A6B4102|nr:protein FAM222B-like [Syngnathus typhle]